MKKFASFLLLLLLFASFSCSNPAEGLTNGAISALSKHQDSLYRISSTLSTTVSTTATHIIADTARSLVLFTKDKVGTEANAFFSASANRIDSTIDRMYLGAERTVSRSLKLTRQELTNPELLYFLADARDTVLGKQTEKHVQALVRSAFQEIRRQQDSTLLALEHRSDSWQERIQHAATPFLSAIGGLVVLSIVILLIVRAAQSAQKQYKDYQTRHKA